MKMQFNTENETQMLAIAKNLGAFQNQGDSKTYGLKDLFIPGEEQEIIKLRKFLGIPGFYDESGHVALSMQRRCEHLVSIPSTDEIDYMRTIIKRVEGKDKEILISEAEIISSMGIRVEGLIFYSYLLFFISSNPSDRVVEFECFEGQRKFKINITLFFDYMSIKIVSADNVAKNMSYFIEGGKITVYTSIPETLALNIVGRPLSSLIDDPLLSKCDMLIEHVETTPDLTRFYPRKDEQYRKKFVPILSLFENEA